MHTPQTQFNNFASEWLESVRGNYRKTSYDSYLRMLDKQILPVIGKLPIGQITPEIIGYVTTGKKEYSPRSKNAVISVIRNVCEYAASEGILLDINWSELFASPEREKLRILSDYEIEKLTKYLTAGGLPELGIFLALHTGVTAAELCALKRGDIDFDNAVLNVSKTLIRVKNEDGEPITKTEIFNMPEAALVRDIPLNEAVLSVMKKRCFCFDEDAFLLTGKLNKSAYPEKVQYYFKKSARECNIHGVKFSVLRDTFADSLIKSGTDIMTVRKYLGATATITVTNRHSTKSAEEMRGKSVKRNEKNKSASVLFCDLTNEWLELVKEKTKPSTYSKYRRDCEKFILPALGDLRLTDILKDDIERFVQSLSGVAPSSVNAMISEINLVFTYAKSCGLKNSLDLGSFKISQTKETIITISESEYSTFKKHLSSNIDLTKAGILLLAETGIKAGELCALKRRDIDFERKSLHVENTVQRVQTENGKTEVIITRLNGRNSVRNITLSEELLELLIPIYGSLDFDSFILTGTANNTEVRALSYRLKNCLAQCGLDQNISFNILRDSYLVRRINAGESLSVTASLMGYSSPEQVKERFDSCQNTKKKSLCG